MTPASDWTFPMLSNEPVAPPPLLVDESDEFLQWPSTGLRMLIGTMLIAKIGGLIVVFTIDPSKMAALFAVISSWLWFAVLGVLLAGPVGFWWRLHRVRRNRAALQRSEWMIEPDKPAAENS